jgi:hypothetical protein
MNNVKKDDDAPVDSGPVVSQAQTSAPDPGAAAVPVPPDAPIVLSQVPSSGWSALNQFPRASSAPKAGGKGEKR